MVEAQPSYKSSSDLPPQKIRKRQLLEEVLANPTNKGAPYAI